MAKSPTQLTLKHFRDSGYTCEIVEHWNAFAKIRVDFLGFADVIALKERIVAIQTTSYGNHAARRNKILGKGIENESNLRKRSTWETTVDKAKAWLHAGGIIVIQSWKKGEKRGEWHQRLERVELKDFEI